ncbi:hypothetical protein QYE76_066956 [Lolium multiflorum]|uniref:Uncharacterized protein n=1 Tax=Lolium multiflorum TaxID=4521 RepID=A0AAD8SD33_LOLMU|nr:hypothetical protein QYE76_066956 [Lolium multiflorum]
MIKLNDEDIREAKKSLKEKGIKPEDVKNLPPIEDLCKITPPSSMIEPFFVAVCGLFTRLCPRFTDLCGLSMRLCLFADFVYVGPSLYIEFCGLFPWLWPHFVGSVYVSLPLYIDFRGLFTWL